MSACRRSIDVFELTVSQRAVACAALRSDAVSMRLARLLNLSDRLGARGPLHFLKCLGRGDRRRIALWPAAISVLETSATSASSCVAISGHPAPGLAPSSSTARTLEPARVVGSPRLRSRQHRTHRPDRRTPPRSPRSAARPPDARSPRAGAGLAAAPVRDRGATAHSAGRDVRRPRNERAHLAVAGERDPSRPAGAARRAGTRADPPPRPRPAVVRRRSSSLRASSSRPARISTVPSA